MAVKQKLSHFHQQSGTSFRCVLPDEKVTSGLEDWMLYKQQLLAEKDTSETTENDYEDIIGQTTTENTVINKLAEHSIRALWKRCEDSMGLSEYTYLKEKRAVRGRPPFAGKSQPHPYINPVK